MERLTKRREDGSVISAIECTNGCKYLSCSMEEGYYCEHQCEADAMCKLADYEDAEEQCIKETAYGFKELLHKWKVFLEDMNELLEYRRLEEQGLLLRLPCKIGDDVYQIPSKVNYDLNVLNGYVGSNRVYHQKVSKIVLVSDHWYLECDKDREYGTGRICLDIFFGETWFLSQEEAEQKLESMKGE